MGNQLPNLNVLFLQLFTNCVIYMHKQQDMLACTQFLDFFEPSCVLLSYSKKKKRKGNRNLVRPWNIYMCVCIYVHRCVCICRHIHIHISGIKRDEKDCFLYKSKTRRLMSLDIRSHCSIIFYFFPQQNVARGFSLDIVFFQCL